MDLHAQTNYIISERSQEILNLKETLHQKELQLQNISNDRNGVENNLNQDSDAKTANSASSVGSNCSEHEELLLILRSNIKELKSEIQALQAKGNSLRDAKEHLEEEVYLRLLL